MATQASKSSRIEARVSPGTKETIAKAAAFQGLTLSEFVVGALIEKAERVIHDREAIALNEAAREVLFDALRRPPAPNKELRGALARHRELIGDRR